MDAPQIACLAAALGAFALLLAVVRLALRRRDGADEHDGAEREDGQALEPSLGMQDDRSASRAEDAPSPGLGRHLELTVEPHKLSIGLVNATLSFRLTLANRGKAPMVALRIASDMLSAHASRPGADHLRGPDMDRAVLQKVPRLDPGHRVSLSAELVLPLGEVQPVTHGAGYAILPLVRLRVVGAGTPPVICTALLGQPPDQENGRLKLFPLKSGPRVYTEISARMLE